MRIIETPLAIIGSGPAGYTAAIYAARACLNPVMISGRQKGGQLTITTDVENFPGFPTAIQGPWLMEQMEAQARNLSVEIIEDQVIEAKLQHGELSKTLFFKTEDGCEIRAQSVIIATGASARWLGLPSEKKLMGHGVSGCATCDGFFYRNKQVVVIGGGNTAAQEALYLTNHATQVTLVHRRDSLRAEKTIQQQLFKHPKIKVLWNREVADIIGDLPPSGKGVTGILLRNNLDNSIEEMAVDGVFIAIGHTPNSGIFRGQLAMDDDGYILTTPGTSNTSIAGVFAAGDVQDKIYRQAITSAGTGCIAALDAEKYLAILNH